MSSPVAAIRPLPENVAAKIKSSTSITHLNGVILELIKNSLDAGARTALISVNFKRGSCIVEDDGNGIPPVEFEPNGGLGKSHRMSCHFAVILEAHTSQIHPSLNKLAHSVIEGYSWLLWLHSRYSQ